MKRLFGWFCGAALLLAGGRLHALDNTGLEVKIPFQKFVLRNGLTLIVHEDHKAPIVAVNTWYHVGSKNERAGRTGFAHLFEHLMFNGSEHYNDDWFKLLEPEGATTLNGTTDFDRTDYFQDVPVSTLDLVLWAESDRMGHLVKAIDQAKLDEQRGVVLNEKRQGENQPYGKVFDLLLESVFPKGHPYSWPVIGHADDLKAATLEDVHAWFKEFYGAANAVLVIAGDVETAAVKAKVEKYYGDIPPGPPLTRHEQWIARRTGTQRRVTQDRVKLPMLLKVWNTPGWGTPENDYLGLVGDILSSGKTSRLYKRLVYDEQIAVEVGAYPMALEIAGGFGIQVMARPGIELARVEKGVDEELQRFIIQGPTAEELKRAQSQRLARFVRGAERVGGFGGKSDILAENEVYAGDPAFYKVTLQRQQSAKAEDLLAAARDWLTDGQFVLEVHPFPELGTQPAAVDRTQRPAAGAPPAAQFPRFERLELPNGLKVLLVQNHTVPMLIVRLLIDAGYAADQFAFPGVAGMTMSMLDEGTKTRTTLQISDELLMMGATLGADANLDQCTVTLNTLKPTLTEALALFADVVFEPSFPEAELERQKQERLAAIQQEKTEPDAMALRVLPKLLYGENHAYSLPLTGSGTEEAVRRMQVKDLREFHARWFRPNNSTLIVVGDTTADEIMPLLQKHFASWPRGEMPRKNLAPAPALGKSAVYLLDKPGAEQSVIFAAQLAPPKANPREFALQLLNTVLGGQFTSRLNLNLREAKHWTYGAHTAVFPAEGQRPFYANAPVQTDKTKESMAEVRTELEQIAATRPPTDEEVQAARRRQTLSLAGRWESMEAVAGSLAEMVRFRLPDDYFQTYAGKVMALTTAEVADAARELVHPEHLVWVVVGDRAKIAPALQELGLGTLRYLDADGKVIE